MTIEKKTIRSDIPGSHVFLNGTLGYVGSAAEDIRRLVVARDITLSGTISDCGTLVIEGTVKTDGFSAARMDILDSGLFSGTADVRDCVIAGRFEGRLTVRGRLTVKPTGRISGDVEYGVLETESGARIEGKMIPMAAAPRETAPALAVLPPPKAMQEEAAPPQNVEPLFSAEDSATGRPAIYRRSARA
ncbi:MAG: polymer-forming cytoskeletal protein [Alphaproteobacteria bacterium]|nr:polymer-forming cytoskeletal protein [Alphaproteobacteria bacterium]MDE2335925.1 polymer-forming cytoskeletal protein [Alphaproteobacteria bacterium]